MVPSVTLKQENCIILGIFIALFGALVFINIFSLQRSVPMTVSAPGRIDKKMESPVLGEKPAGQKIEAPQYGEQGLLKEWGRDPFTSAWLSGGSASAEPLSPDIKTAEPTVTLILMSDATKIAAINNRIVQEGDMLQDEKVIKIKNDGVVLLRKDGMQRFLPLRKDSITFKENEN